MKNRRIIIGGNWKMFKTPSEAANFTRAFKVKVVNVDNVDMVICPPFPDLPVVRDLLSETRTKIGAQNLHWQDEGAFTGEVSAQMLRDVGCDYVIVGHSERRHVFGERNEEINKKVRKATERNLIPIFCVGETIEERRGGLTEKVIEEQVLKGLAEIELIDAQSLVIAYEPVWAIGTGETATPEQAEEVHVFIRGLLSRLFGDEVANELRIQYGGSVKPANAAELLSQPNIDGALVGGASLDADDFSAIIKSAAKITK